MGKTHSLWMRYLARVRELTHRMRHTLVQALHRWFGPLLVQVASASHRCRRREYVLGILHLALLVLFAQRHLHVVRPIPFAGIGWFWNPEDARAFRRCLSESPRHLILQNVYRAVDRHSYGVWIGTVRRPCRSIHPYCLDPSVSHGEDGALSSCLLWTRKLQLLARG